MNDQTKELKATHYYQSITSYAHEVYKCCGMLHEEEERRLFFRDYYKKNEVGCGYPGTFKVLELPYCGDRINEDGTPYTG